jgi:serine/threonine protein kinase
VDGTPFGQYRLIELLGRGGMGEVWRAYDTVTDRVVALKVLPANFAEDSVFQQRFRREAHAAAQLNEPHVVPIHTYGEIDGRLFVDMRLIEGRDLQTVLADSPLSPERAVQIIEQVAQALNAAHAVGLVHRDVKPSNILVDDNDFAYLIDFGIARAAGEAALTNTGAAIGTWSYMAPERFQGDTADARVDIYALGCVLYESLTGQLPFPGQTLEQIAVAHMTQPPPRPSEIKAGIPATMDDVIATGMAKNPDKRYASAVELARAGREATTMPLSGPGPTMPASPLSQPSHRATIHHQDTQLADTVAAPVPPPSGPPHQVTDTPPPRSRRRWLIALLVVVLIAAVGVGVVLLRNVLSPKPSASELVLTAATDPGVNSFMPPAASPPPTATQPPPTLQPHGDGTTVVSQPLPGDRDGLYGGTLNNAECDRDKMISFLGAHPAQAGAFVEALNTDSTVFWSGGRALTTADIPAYLRELTPVLLRLDTRVTNHGFDGSHPTTLQSVFQAGTAVLLDAHGVPRARCYCGNPLTAPVALTGEPKPVGTSWPGYKPAALADVQPSTVTITVFVLVDVVTGQPFNRPAGTTGADDTPHSQPVAPPQPAPTTPTPGQGNQLDIDGTYLMHRLTDTCQVTQVDRSMTVTRQGNTLTMNLDVGFTLTGTLDANGSFQVSGGPAGRGGGTMRGVFATEGGRTVIRDGTYQTQTCSATWEGTKQ